MTKSIMMTKYTFDKSMHTIQNYFFKFQSGIRSYLLMGLIILTSNFASAQIENLTELVEVKYGISLEDGSYEIGSGNSFQGDLEEGQRYSYDILWTENDFFVFVSMVTDSSHYFNEVFDVLRVRRVNGAYVSFINCDEKSKKGRPDLFSVYFAYVDDPPIVYKTDPVNKKIIESEEKVVSNCASSQ